MLQQEAANARAQSDLQRYTILAEKQEISKSDFDQYSSNAKQQAANLQAVQAAVLAAARPAFAQMDFSGEWAPVQDEDNTGNPYVGEFLGIPMSRAGSLRAQAWNASLYTLPEWQCRPHTAPNISPRFRRFSSSVIATPWTS